MKSITEIISEAALNPKQLTFIPVEIQKSKVGKYGVAVGGIFNIKKVKYAQEVEKNLVEIGVSISTGISKALEIVKQSSTKLIYLMYNQNGKTFAMICNENILKPLDGSKLK